MGFVDRFQDGLVDRSTWPTETPQLADYLARGQDVGDWQADLMFHQLWSTRVRSDPEPASDPVPTDEPEAYATTTEAELAEDEDAEPRRWAQWPKSKRGKKT